MVTNQALSVLHFLHGGYIIPILFTWGLYHSYTIHQLTELIPNGYSFLPCVHQGAQTESACLETSCCDYINLTKERSKL